MGHWLSEQHEVKSGDGEESWKLVKTWKVDHVQTRENNKINLANRFSISESGTLGDRLFRNPIIVRNVS